MPIEITDLAPADWSRVQEIYAAGMETGQATFETAVPDWEEWDGNHLPTVRLVAREGGEIVGWAALSPVSERPAYAGVAEVSIYVDPLRFGEGFGTILMAALVDASETAGIWTLQSSVFRENGATMALHTNHGFRQIGFRERVAQHHGVWRDTVILERRSPLVGTE